ncbi:unnamed protein product [Chilo suppressalis]|uniref:Uncharacterized protein n=1 Tax=Chilo suppressalis TaxID=168631 RepID=A0ABN8B4U0_CHISP|nr:unnamed protein product [Chilo suppressalis]
MRFQDKVVVITGASSGIGAAAAKLLVKEGASVVLVARNQEKLANVEKQCAAIGKSPLVIRADVANEKDAKRIIDETIDKYGKLDILVNNAGIFRFDLVLSDTLMKSFDEIMNVNLRAAVLITSLASPHLIKTKGNIINISSSLGQVIKMNNCISYATSKAALDHFTRGAALELSAHGVRVNAISPGPVRTDIMENAGIATSWDDSSTFTALNRVSEPEEVADLIAFLASDAAKGITGSNYAIENGASLK